MHFLSKALDFSDLQPGLKFPVFKFVDGLLMEREELLEFQELSKRIQRAITNTVFDLAQELPELLERYKVPD